VCARVCVCCRCYDVTLTSPSDPYCPVPSLSIPLTLRLTIAQLLSRHSLSSVPFPLPPPSTPLYSTQSTTYPPLPSLSPIPSLLFSHSFSPFLLPVYLSTLPQSHTNGSPHTLSFPFPSLPFPFLSFPIIPTCSYHISPLSSLRPNFSPSPTLLFSPPLPSSPLLSLPLLSLPLLPSSLTTGIRVITQIPLPPIPPSPSLPSLSLSLLSPSSRFKDAFFF
jgi:hypothetical protein